MRQQLNEDNIALVYIELPHSNHEQDEYELRELVATAQGNVRLWFEQKRNSVDVNTVLGSGKLDELKAAIGTLDCEMDAVIFSCPLSATQRATLSKRLDCRILDKIDLILDIFALRAKSAEGKKQVELAQLTYNLATKPEGGFSRQGGGIGTRGPGETKLETSKRVIRDRIYRLRQELKEIESHRDVTRRKRKQNSLFTVTLVGYTNAGKSTLFNKLTQADVYADDKLFATLDTTVRKITLPCGIDVLLCDTVGFLHELPHQLFNAFKSTLEEAVNADLLLNVCDICDPNVANQIAVTESTLAELHCDAPIIRVFNKCDKLTNTEALHIAGESTAAVFISALTEKNLDVLLQLISDRAMEKYASVTLSAPHENSAQLLSSLNKCGATCKEVTYLDDSIKIKAIVPKNYVNVFAKYLCFD